MILSKQQILDSNDLKRETVKVPEWGGSVLVQAMSGVERDRFEASMRDADRKVDLINLRAKLVARCIVGEDGTRLFSDEDVEALGGKSGRALDRIAKVAQRLCGIGDDEIEEIRGN